MKHILIIGGGASGIAAALSAAQADPTARITLLEGLDRIGKKILVTGNGRCNLGNEDISPEHYHTTQPGAFAPLLASMPSQLTVDFFRSLGLMCATEDQGRVYPYCRQASMVLDVLLLALERSRVTVRCGCRVTAARRTRDGFDVETETGEIVSADRLILACGGMAAPKQGVTGVGYALAQGFGHSVTPLYPCLTALRSTTPQKGLKGIRIQAGASLVDGERVVACEQGEVQFTDYGLSGIPTFQLSCHLPKCGKNRAVLKLDLFPHLTQYEVRKQLDGRIRLHADEMLETVFLGTVPKKVLFAALKYAGMDTLARRADTLSRREVERIAAALKGWDFPISGSLGWEQAQVTGGGIPLTEIGTDFASLGCPGLYLTGELLDAVGDCGGYNLHWAWCSGLLAGAAAAT